MGLGLVMRHLESSFVFLIAFIVVLLCFDCVASGGRWGGVRLPAGAGLPRPHSLLCNCYVYV